MLLKSLIVPVAFALPTLTACAAEEPEITDSTATLPEVSAESFADVKAELDFDTGTATTPISEYLTNMDFETLVLFSQARERLITDCMAAASQTYDGLTSVDWDSLQPQEDRIFGLWDRAGAARLGTMLDETRGVPRTTTVDQGVDFNNALTTCNEQAAADDVLGPLSEDLNELTLADRILGNSAELAQQSKVGKAATESFKQCMEEKSIVLDPTSGYMSAEYTDLGKEAEVAAAVGEADCNVDTGRIEELYDLRAQGGFNWLSQHP
ncbi:hypothetical protein, partial [Leucobacter sp. wl10]|uniref:hypothetical protein n=1 Tax=Leucobacter sp. wl10 TaxID=2304677 RepID=UPI000E7FDCCE